MKYSKETKVGLLTVFCLIAIFVGFNWLKGKNIFSNTNRFYAVYDRIDGLITSNPVVYKGLNVGRVAEIKLTQDGKIMIAMEMRNDINVPSTSVARIISNDILGSKAIELVFGRSEAFAVSGDTLASDLELSLSESVNKQVLPVKAKAEKLISSMDSLLISVQYIITPAFRTSVRESVLNVEKATKTFDSLISDQYQRLKAITEHVESIANNIRDNNEAIASVIQNLNKITDSLAGSNLQMAVNNASAAMVATREVMDKVNNGEGSLGLLVNDEELYRNLAQSSADLDSLLVDLKENPSRYVSVSVFKKKEKK